MKLDDLQKNWDELGETDAMWAVLTNPNKKDGKWTPEEFFKTGETEIATALSELKSRNIAFNTDCALDFGCGVGRLTQALAGHFREAHGVDIAPSMLKQANCFNQFPDRCYYHLNSENNLRLFATQKFDFIYSFIVFQHIEGRYVLDYIREFTRLLKPGGIAMFHFIEPPFWRQLIPSFLLDAYRKWKQGEKAFVWEFGVSESGVASVLREAGVAVLGRKKTPRAKKGWSDLYYIVQAPSGTANGKTANKSA